MNTHKNSHFLQWLKAERMPLLWSALGAFVVLLLSAGVNTYQARLIDSFQRITAPSAPEVEHVLTSKERRQLIRMKRLVRRIALRQKLAAFASSQASLRAGPSPVESTRNVAQSAVTDVAPASSLDTKSASSSAKVTEDRPPISTRDDTVAQCAPFIGAVFPVSKIPNWGAMRSPDVWNLDYANMPADQYVGVPRFDIKQLTIPRKSLIGPPIPDENIPTLTAKLFYSTRFFAKYDIDSGEFEAVHPGIDLKLPSGTPVGAVAGGTVTYAGNNDRLGNHVIIRHCADDGDYYSIYAHFSSVAVQAGQTVTPGKTVGYVGMTGKTSGPHLHIQIDRKQPSDTVNHTPYYPDHVPSRSEADRFTVHPVQFIGSH